MDPQREEIVKYLQEYMQEENHQDEGLCSSTLAALSSPVGKAIRLVLDENHITRCPPQITCNLLEDDLQAVKELRVDFNNFMA